MLSHKHCERVFRRERLRRGGWRGLVDLFLRRKPVLREYVCGAPLVVVPHSASRGSRFTCVRCEPLP